MGVMLFDYDANFMIKNKCNCRNIENKIKGIIYEHFLLDIYLLLFNERHLKVTDIEAC